MFHNTLSHIMCEVQKDWMEKNSAASLKTLFILRNTYIWLRKWKLCYTRKILGKNLFWLKKNSSVCITLPYPAPCFKCFKMFQTARYTHYTLKAPHLTPASTIFVTPHTATHTYTLPTTSPFVPHFPTFSHFPTLLRTPHTSHTPLHSSNGIMLYKMNINAEIQRRSNISQWHS